MDAAHSAVSHNLKMQEGVGGCLTSDLPKETGKPGLLSISTRK